MIKQRKVPLRICIACREQKPKRELLRVVRTPDGEVVYDPRGKQPGRGAYICCRFGCLQQAIKGRKLEKHLERPPGPGLYAELTALMENDPEDDEGS